MRKLAALFLILFATAGLACAPGADDAAPEAAASASADPAEDVVAENARDAWSKPTEVYAFVGIEPGDVVLDLLAGGGYNTLKVAELVGAEGRVIAERARPELKRQIEEGEIETAAPVEFIGWIDELQPDSVDVILSIRAYHLFEDVPGSLAMLYAALKPGGVVGVVDIRLNEETGHNMETHRVGDQTVISDFENAGFQLVESSDLLRVEGDDYTIFVPEGKQRYETDRLLLKFAKPTS